MQEVDDYFELLFDGIEMRIGSYKFLAEEFRVDVPTGTIP